jgi:predicted nucleotide-binding protein
MFTLIAVQTPRYHIYIEYAEPDKSGVRFNVNQEELVRTFASPFIAGKPFWFMGRLLNPIKVTKTIIFWSYETADKLSLPNKENLLVAKDKRYLIESILKSKVKGTYVCTEKFLSSPEKNKAATQSGTATSWDTRRRIFVVSGSDSEMKQALTEALTRLGLVPLLLCEEPSQGRKIVERFIDYADIGFAVVLLSPDDFVYAGNEAPSKRKLKPRQDVVFELGFILGKIGKDKVLAFYKEHEGFEIPDFEGIRLVAFDNRESWKLAIVRELAKSGFQIDADRIIN